MLSMSTSALEDPVVDVELGEQKRRQRRRRRRQRQYIAGGNETSQTEGSRYLTESEDDHQSWQSSWGSAVGGSLDECRFPEIERRRRGEIGEEIKTEAEMVVSEFDDYVDLESGEVEMVKVHVSRKKRVRRDCRICHMRLMGSDVGIELGCLCKGDLGDCHKQCAETWFRIKGNTICEICGAMAVNVMIELQPIMNEASIMNMAAAAVSAANFAPSMANANVDPSSSNSDAQDLSCHGRRVMNVLFTCLVLAFVISWLFHSNFRTQT